MPRECIFCGANNLSAEHVLPEWISNLLRRPGGFRTEGEHLHVRRWIMKGDTINQTVRCACVACNTGWMSRLEVIAKPALAPLIEGWPCSLSVHAKNAIACWATKTAMTLESGSAHDRTRYFQRSECAAIAQSRTLPGVASVWLGYLLPNRMAASMDIEDIKFHAESDSFNERGAGMVATLTLGALVIQGLFMRVSAEPGTEVELSPSHDFTDRTIEVWPNVGRATWPPSTPFQVEDIPSFRKRWSAGT